LTLLPLCKLASTQSLIIMVALWNRADHYIFILWSLLLLLLLLLSSFFFSHLISAVTDWMSAIGWCGLSANLGCRSETCCTRLAENTGRKTVAKNHHLGTIAQLCRAISSQLSHVSTIGKKIVSSNMSSRCPHNIVNFGGFQPLAAEIDLTVWGTPANFNGFRDLAAFTAQQSSSECQPNFAALNKGRHLCSAGRP